MIAHIKARKLTFVQAARELRIEGVNPSATVRRWAIGSMRPDADMVERIEKWSGGAVTARDMHETRLDWLRANRPERFDDHDDGQGGAGDGGSGRKAGPFDPPVAVPVYDEPFTASPHGNPVTKFFRGFW